MHHRPSRLVECDRHRVYAYMHIMHPERMRSPTAFALGVEGPVCGKNRISQAAGAPCDNPDEVNRCHVAHPFRPRLHNRRRQQELTHALIEGTHGFTLPLSRFSHRS